MIIVLEGNEATGKTVLGNVIRRITNDTAKIIHAGPPKLHPLLEWAKRFDDNPDIGNVVFDRLHWGESVYGPLYRGEDALGPHGFRWFEMLTNARGAVTVLADGHPDEILKRVIALNDDMVEHTLRAITDIQDAYIRLLPDALTTVYHHNFDNELEVDPNQLVAAAVKRFINTPWSFSATGYIGVANPDVVLVGSDNADSPFHTLPLPPLPDTPGETLMKTVLMIPGAKSWGLVNIGRADGPMLPQLFSDLGQPAKVALGRSASEWMSSYGYEHGTTTHPSEVENMDAYAVGLLSAARTQSDTRWLV